MPAKSAPLPRSQTFPDRADVGQGVLLDARGALIHPEQGWMAVADVHFGYEARRQRAGALLPDWGMPQCEASLHTLLLDHEPRRLILVGDIMDGGGSVDETLALLNRLRARVEVVCVEGNHDRAGLRRGVEMTRSHQEAGFLFEHGHLPLSDHEGVVITGHEHPAINLRDGAGLRLRLPVLVQEQTAPATQRWILPAFSPWAAGGEYRSEHARLKTWVCAPGRVWRA